MHRMKFDILMRQIRFLKGVHFVFLCVCLSLWIHLYYGPEQNALMQIESVIGTDTQTSPRHGYVVKKAAEKNQPSPYLL